jgi:DNA polymerase III sliding clamp (beta) subunit (PCNA family)
MRKITVDARNFYDALSKVSKVPQKSVIPILEEVLVQVSDGRCTLSATDLNTWLAVDIPAQGDDLSFAFIRTQEVMRACGHFDGELTLEVSGPSSENSHFLDLYLHCGHRSAEFRVNLADDYPVFPQVEDGPTVTINASHLYERIERVRYATSKSGKSTRVISTCVQCVDPRVFSLDGFRMACDTDENLKFPRHFMARGTQLAHLKLFGNAVVTAQIGMRYVHFTDDAMSLTIRTVEAVPFDLDAAIPKTYQNEFYVSPKNFLQELDFLKKFTSDASKPYVQFRGDELMMSVPGGKYRTSIKLNGSNDITLSFDLFYMMDALRQFKGEQWIKMKLSGVYSPMILEAEGRGDIAMVLPARLRSELAA